MYYLADAGVEEEVPLPDVRMGALVIQRTVLVRVVLMVELRNGSTGVEDSPPLSMSF